MVRLINSLPTPAIPAAGGPSGLLNITRLLAAQDLAKGDTPASMSFTIPDSSAGDGGVNGEQLSVGPVVGDGESKANIAKERNRKLADSTCTPQTDQDPLLKVKCGAMLLAGGEAAGDVLMHYSVEGWCCALWTHFTSMCALCYSPGSVYASLPGAH